LELHGDATTWCGFNSTSEFAITASHDNCIIIWQVLSGDVMQVIKFNSSV